MQCLQRNAILLIAAAFVAGSARLPSEQSVDLVVPGRNSANPSIAAVRQFVAVAWGASTTDNITDVYTAVSRDAGNTFDAPTPVSDAESRPTLSDEQPPRVVLLPRPGLDPIIVVVWTSRGDGGTRLLSVRSDDGGKSYARPLLVPGSEAPGNRGWHATAVDSRGNVVAVWLDHRELAKSTGRSAAREHSAHQHSAHAEGRADGASRAQLSKLYFARLDDAGEGRPLTGGVCYCCKTTIATDVNGAIYTAWRHVYPGNIRDIAFAMSRDGGSTFDPPTRVSEDEWVLEGCPENGPAIAVDGSSRIHVVWPTLVQGGGPGGEPTLQLLHAMSTDGHRFRVRQPLPTDGTPLHPQITVTTQGTVFVMWEEHAQGVRRIALARGTMDPMGTIGFARQVVSDAPGVSPAIAALSNRIVMVWASGPRDHMRLRVTRMPQ